MNVFPPPGRRKAQAGKADAQLGAQLLDLDKVLTGLGVRSVDVGQGRAGKLELAGRLQAHRRAVAHQGDDLAAFLHGRPAEAGQAIEQGLDPVRSLIGDGGQARPAKGELFVLGADGELAGGLAAFFEFAGQVSQGQARVGVAVGHPPQLPFVVVTHLKIAFRRFKGCPALGHLASRSPRC